MQSSPRQPHDLLLHAKDLTWGYHGSPSMVFFKFNFGLYKHDFCVITGKSGSGKTTLAKLLTGQYPVAKKMLFHRQEDMSRFSVNEVQALRRKIGIIFQDYKLIPRKTVRENIALPLGLIGMPLTLKNQTIDHVLKVVGLTNHAEMRADKLSGGEQQLVAIARAIVHKPEFIIADEPTGNLDPETSRKIADLLIQLNDMGHTIMFITHDESLKEYIKSKTKISEYTIG
ncbi:Cell division ATP-binding protein FtsE [candidate division SR1 bacterium Aalborg_AAW-1]|nr:Cell division ATP-binding protein FtsE [candidate division SR1 bacterium Aalborg_AAW-1]